MKVKDYLFKYFKFNRKSEKPFVYSFFPMHSYKIKDIDIDKIKEVLFLLSNDYYSYSFDKEETLILEDILLDEDKCIISKDLRLGIFYDHYKSEMHFFNDELLRKLPFNSLELGLVYIDYIKEIVERNYSSKIINPSNAYKHLIGAFIDYPMIAGRKDYIPTSFDELTKEEREVFIDIIIDFGHYNGSLLLDAVDYFPEERITNHLKHIYTCDTIPDRVKNNLMCKLYSRTKEVFNFDKIKYYLRNEYKTESYLKYFVKAPNDLFNVLAKESLMNFSISRLFSYYEILKRNFDLTNLSDIKKVEMYNTIMDPKVTVHSDLSDTFINKTNVIENYEEFVDEFLSLTEINDDIVDFFIKKYR